MALFLRGKYKGFYKATNSECVRDIFRFNKTSENKVSFELVRRDMASVFRRFLRVESARMTLHPLDPNNPRQGGKVSVSSLVFDVRTFTFKFKTYYGIYGDDFLQYGEFKSGVDPLEDEELLLKVTEDVDKSHDVLQKVTFRFSDDNLSFSHDVNESKLDAEVDYEISENKLSFCPKASWSERLFYGIGNQEM